LDSNDLYLRLKSKINKEERCHLFVVMEELVRLKEYKENTFYLACSIVDRYIVSLARSNHQPKCLMNLAVIAILMAAKIEQPISPSFRRMIKLIKDEWGVNLKKQDLFNLEEDIIRELDFDLQVASPIVFQERYQRIFGLDREETHAEAKQVGQLARLFCRQFTKNGVSQRYKASKVGAVSLILAMNISKSEIAGKLALQQFKNVFSHSKFASDTMKQDHFRFGPLAEWNESVEKLTLLSRDQDFIELYGLFLSYLNKSQYEGALNEDSSLFLNDHRLKNA